MSSWFSVKPPTSGSLSSPQSPSNSLGSNLIHPVSSCYGPEYLFGTLLDQDTAWLAQSTGFVTETQTFYITIPGDLPKYDRRFCKSDHFSILLDPNHSDTYSITGKHDDEIHFQFNLTRMDGIPGWKSGHDARGGFTYFGQA
ncbi:hypothetical protein O181_074397 [Austropuccinia psidii MF-1]|uniref:Svf1-like N-terminal domain-containing protein n=1 Tax=Austropuccinia psidii MF-1 TaxID=1389203 RepID=A0A9Q3FAU6_9BASI|nr:hypothetical protein [Austropuccinia psidii MF-1]